MVTRETVQQMANRIAERFHPRRIVLFGSYARGEATEHSDVDLLIVVRDLPLRGKRSAPIIRMLAEEYHVPVDVIVRSEATLTEWKDVYGTFSNRVSEEGIVLYEEAE